MSLVSAHMMQGPQSWN